MPDDDEITIEIRCPQCKKPIKIKKRDADREMIARCPDGHEVPLVKAIE